MAVLSEDPRPDASWRRAAFFFPLLRTTLTLDPDVAAQLKAAMRERGLSLKEQVNAALRAGLLARTPRKKQRAVTRTFDGGRALVDFESTSRALAFAQGETHR